MLFKNLKNIDPEITSHGCGKKFVFVNKENSQTNLMQVAVGELTHKDTIDWHLHPSMDEFYYFLEGKALFHIGNESFVCEPETFVMVPCNIKHKLSTNSIVKFLYWGIKY